ncbi:MAG: hypothetical protein HUK14_07035 [Muribaculaceae bacterium]|nr:hypothetical protein [Muribaculaceae bacterium]
MKKQAKSLIALAVALSLGLGFSSCKKDEPEPEPTPTKETTFYNSLSLSSTILEYFDITMQYTNAEGKTTSVDIKQCPETKMKFVTSEGQDEVSVRTFTADSKSTKLPAETSIKLTYKYNGKVPADEINVGVAGTFKINGRSNPSEHSHYARGIDPEGMNDLATFLNEQYSTYILKVDAQDNYTYIIGSEK